MTDHTSSIAGDTSLGGGDVIVKQVTEIFRTKLNRQVPSADTDLVERGFLDSLAFVDLLMFLERSYGIAVGEDMLEIDNFRTVNSIAEFVAKHKNGSVG